MIAAGTVIVGAGIAGLACARELAAAGDSPLVLERSRGVGGRCATRRVEGQPVDLGPAFLHGSDPGFLEDLRAARGRVLSGWPRRVQGRGAPCQPEAFSPEESRLAFEEGLTVFPKHLARGLDVRLLTPVVAVEVAGRDIRLLGEGGEQWRSERVVIAAASEQTLELLAPLAGISPEIAGACALLGLAGSLPCLALLAGYPLEVPPPPWDVLYPEDSAVLQLVSHDSSKRRDRRFVVLVAQARSGWSRHHLDEPAEDWGEAILRETARVVGPWAGEPLWTDTHRWRYARIDSGNELTRPLLLSLPGGARLGIAGELFARGGGLQAAWTSGRGLGWRLAVDGRA